MFAMFAWLFFSYALVFAVGAVFVAEVDWLPGITIFLGFPCWRLLRRLGKYNGYRLTNGLNPSSSASRAQYPSGLVTKTSHPALFTFCFKIEVLIVVGLIGVIAYVEYSRSLLGG